MASKFNGYTPDYEAKKGDAEIAKGPRKGEIAELKFLNKGNGSFNVVTQRPGAVKSLKVLADKYCNRVGIYQMGKVYYVAHTPAQRKKLYQRMYQHLKILAKYQAADPFLARCTGFSYKSSQLSKKDFIRSGCTVCTSAAAVRRTLNIPSRG